MMPYGQPFPPPPYGGGMPPPYGAGMPPMPPPYGAPMMPGMMPPPGFGDPVGFLLPSLFKAIGGLFGGKRRPPPPPPSMAMPMQAGLPPLPPLFYSDRPQFCRTFCPPMPGATPGGGGGGRRRRRRRG